MFTKVKNCVSDVTSKIENSALYQKGMKLATIASTCGIGMAALSIASSAADVDWGGTAAAAGAVGQISSNASGFVEPAIIIMCSVGGLKLGMRLLKGSTH